MPPADFTRFAEEGESWWIFPDSLKVHWQGFSPTEFVYFNFSSFLPLLICQSLFTIEIIWNFVVDRIRRVFTNFYKNNFQISVNWENGGKLSGLWDKIIEIISIEPEIWRLMFFGNSDWERGAGECVKATPKSQSQQKLWRKLKYPQKSFPNKGVPPTSKRAKYI